MATNARTVCGIGLGAPLGLTTPATRAAVAAARSGASPSIGPSATWDAAFTTARTAYPGRLTVGRRRAAASTAAAPTGTSNGGGPARTACPTTAGTRRRRGSRPAPRPARRTAGPMNRRAGTPSGSLRPANAQGSVVRLRLAACPRTRTRVPRASPARPADGTLARAPREGTTSGTRTRSSGTTGVVSTRPFRASRPFGSVIAPGNLDVATAAPAARFT